MQVTKNGIDTAEGPGDWFTGAVYIDSVAALGRIAAECEQHPLHPRGAHGLALARERPADLRDRGHLPVATWGDQVTDEEYGAAPPIES